MKYTIELDNDKYVNGIVHYGDERDLYDDNFIFDTFYKDGHRIDCYKLVDNEVVFDEDKYNKLSEVEHVKQEMARIQKELEDYDYIGTKISMGVATREEYTEQIAYTEELREQIRELEKDL